MQLQRTLTKNRKTELYYDLIELLTGLLLAGFLWMHLFLESTITMGMEVFNNLAHTLDKNFLPYIGIPGIIIVFFTHFLVAGRRIPTRFQEQKIIWQHAKLLRHLNTWAWVFQVVSGMAILILGSVHMWVVITDWPIEAAKSAARVHSSYWSFYILLLLLSVIHAGIGLYRQFIKWGWFARKPVGIMLSIISTIIIGLGLAAIFAFIQIGGIQ